MRPQRIVVGEVRQQECLDLLIALNSGIPGNAEAYMNSRDRRESSPPQRFLDRLCWRRPWNPLSHRPNRPATAGPNYSPWSAPFAGSQTTALAPDDAMRRIRDAFADYDRA
jgi:hypothetical protein